MFTTDEQISPPSPVCKENSLLLYSSCADITFKFTASGILFYKAWQLYNFKTRLGSQICSFEPSDRLLIRAIHHFHIDHNTPCLPPKILRNHCFQFFQGRPKGNRRQCLCKILGGTQSAFCFM